MSLGSMNWKSIKSWIYFYFIDIQMKDNRIENVIMLIVFIFWREKKNTRAKTSAENLGLLFEFIMIFIR